MLLENYLPKIIFNGLKNGFDDDKVCITNINRQILATSQTVGKYKVDVAEERIKSINPEQR